MPQAGAPRRLAATLQRGEAVAVQMHAARRAPELRRPVARSAAVVAALVLAPRALGCAEAGDELRRDVGLGLPRVMLGSEARPPDAEAALLRVLGEHLLHLEDVLAALRLRVEHTHRPLGLIVARALLRPRRLPVGAVRPVGSLRAVRPVRIVRSALLARALALPLPLLGAVGVGRGEEGRAGEGAQPLARDAAVELRLRGVTRLTTRLTQRPLGRAL
mmetsp:Transcript_30491/g.77755  ORF Transcript_30491/g.77755 Transcript_30491/m.77755 type:complete len:218 (-) Transcript_30491:468-1121(-)